MSSFFFRHHALDARAPRFSGRNGRRWPRRDQLRLHDGLGNAALVQFFLLPLAQPVTQVVGADRSIEDLTLADVRLRRMLAQDRCNLRIEVDVDFARCHA